MSIKIYRMQLESIGTTPLEARRIIAALRSAIVIEGSKEKQLEYLRFFTSSPEVREFLDKEINQILNDKSGASLKWRVLVGDYGSGKSHLKTYLIEEIKARSQDFSYPIVSYSIPPDHVNYNLFKTLLFANPGNDLRIYRWAYLGLLKKCSDKNNLLESIKDWLLINNTTNKKIKDLLYNNFLFPEPFISTFLKLGDASQSSEHELLTIIREFCENGSGEELFLSFLNLLNFLGVKSFNVFFDEVNQIELSGWVSARHAFAAELAQLHDKLGFLFKSSGISVYFMLKISGRLWFGEDSGISFVEICRAERLIQRIQNCVYQIPRLNQLTMLEIFKKLISLYQITGYRISDDIEKALPRVIMSLQKELGGYLTSRSFITNTIKILDRNVR